MHLQVKSSVSVLVSIPLLLQQPSKSSFEAAPKLGQKCVKQSCSFLLCCGTWGPACIHALPLQAPAKESCWGGSECRNLMGTVQSCSKEAMKLNPCNASLLPSSKNYFNASYSHHALPSQLCPLKTLQIDCSRVHTNTAVTVLETFLLIISLACLTRELIIY